MNIRILQILLLLVVITVKAQNTQVIYIDANKKYKKYTPRNTNKTELRAVKNLNKIVSVKKNVTFELIYNDKKSVFKREEMLIPKGEEMHYALAFVSIPSGSYFFKDNKENYKVKESSGEIFKIFYPNNQYDWKITKETKTILGYKCYKATAVYKEYDYGRDVELEKNYTVWFTYDIPLPYGPFGLTGLPGVILEGQKNSNGFNKLHLKAKEIKTIKKFPKIPKGRKIDYIEYNKYQGDIYKGIKKRQAK
ncbi:GLPGLI family protein [Tenacibaculum ovolyticum]|uniref:GLPGLI family protein n=1 Tax=Tenacibaculum ovolyticum TaxID=104270 RepID=UPI003BAC74C9